MAGLTLFGTSGIRGDPERLFTNQFCFDIGRAFAIFLDRRKASGPVAVGMDPRGSSPRILEAIETGLDSAGREIVEQGAVCVPAMNWVLKIAPYSGSIMVTGSHISANLNGLKFFTHQEEISKKDEAEIRTIYQEVAKKIPFRKKEIDSKEENRASEAYQEMLVNLAGKLSVKKIIVDPGNGAQSDIMPQVLKRIGLPVKEINASLQGEFISRDTETEEVLKELQEKVLEEKADLGIAYDYDGDRVVFVDEKGQLIPGDYTGALIAKNSKTAFVITPINTSQVVEHLGKPVIRTKVGSPYVVEAMKKNQAAFGFEANGGGISSEIMYSRDAGSTTIKILKLLEQSGKKLSHLVATLPRFYLYRLKIDCPMALNQKILDQAAGCFKGIKTETLDGLKIWLDNSSWILFRPSGNAPEFRVFAEAETKEKAEKLAKEGLDLINETIHSKNN